MCDLFASELYRCIICFLRIAEGGGGRSGVNHSWLVRLCDEMLHRKTFKLPLRGV